MGNGPKVLLTGPPGVGKTTVIRRFLATAQIQAGGFYTEEIRRRGRRTGFALNLMSGERRILASIDIRGHRRVGKYGVDVEGFEAAVVPEIETAIAETRLIVLDEIGKMELFSDDFREVVRRAIDCRSPVVGTILSRPHPFADEIRARRGVAIIEVTTANRDRLPAELSKRFDFAAG